MFKKLLPFIVVVALLVTGVTTALAAPAHQANQTIVDIAVNDGRFTTTLGFGIHLINKHTLYLERL